VPEPIVFISHSRVAPGRRDDFGTAYARAIDLIASTKPRTALFAAYLDETEATVSIVHVFPDAAAMNDHFMGSDERTASVAELIQLAGFEVYGPAPTPAIEQLRRVADAGGFGLVVNARSLGGFLRAPS
jgi:hypothetical protein